MCYWHDGDCRFGVLLSLVHVPSSSSVRLTNADPSQGISDVPGHPFDGV
jgi:hypothetical protein